MFYLINTKKKMSEKIYINQKKNGNKDYFIEEK